MTISLIKEPKDWAELEDKLRKYEGYPSYNSHLEVHHNKTIKSESYRAAYKDVFFIAERIVTNETNHYGNSSYAITKTTKYKLYAQYYVVPSLKNYSSDNVKSVDVTMLFKYPDQVYSAFEQAKERFECKTYLPVIHAKLFDA